MRRLSLVALAAGLAMAHAGVALADPAGDTASRDAAAAERQDQDDGDDGAEHAPRYAPFTSLTAARKLEAAGLRYTFGPLPGGGFGFSATGAEPLRSGVQARYDAATGAVSYTSPDGMSVTFTAADEVAGQSRPEARLFNKANPAGGVFGGSLSTPFVGGVALDYTRFGTFYSTGTPAGLDGHAFVLGTATRPWDLPRRGTASYATMIGGTAFTAGTPAPLQLTGSSASFSINFASNSIATNLNLIGIPAAGGAAIALDTLSGTGSIGSARPGFSGQFTGTGTVGGTFSGAFFGPGAAEFGYDFLVGGTNGAGRQFTAIGGVAGTTAAPPPPPPPPVYTAFQNLAGVQSFAAAGLGYTVTAVPSGGIGFALKGSEPAGSGVAVQYDPASGTITYTAPGGASATFTAANEVPGQSTPAARVFNQPNPAGGVFGGSLSVPSVGGVALSYTRFGTFYAAGTPAGLDGHAFVLGVQTLPGDMPASGTATYSAMAGGSVFLATGGATVPLSGSTATLTADFSSGSISTSLALMMTPAGGTASALDVVTGTGALAAVKPGFAGSLTGSGTVSGTFAGSFFGPQASEFGYDFIVGGTTTGGTGFTAIGGAAGIRP